MPFIVAIVLILSGNEKGNEAAEGYSGLVGTDLTFIKERDTIGEIFRKESAKLQGTIHRIRVLEDSEARVRLRVDYSGFADCDFEFQPLDGDRKAMRDVFSPSVKGTKVDGIGEYTIALNPQYNRSQEVTCDFLELRIVRDHGLGSQVRQYTLPKRWRTVLQAQNLLIPVPVVPLRSASLLPMYLSAAVPAQPSPESRIEKAAGTQAQGILAPGLAVQPKVTVQPRYNATPVLVAPPANQILPQAAAAKQPAAPVPAAKQHIVTATLPAAQLLAVNPKINYIQMRRGISPEDVQRGAQGPSMDQINLLESFTADVNLAPTDLSSVSLTLYRDKNPSSGILYFRPNSFNLSWDADSGYGMRMLYKTTASSGQAGSVLIAGRLDSGVDSTEIQLIKDLIVAYRARHSNIAFSELRPLPIDEEPKVSLSSGLQRLFDISADRIALTSIADALAQIQIEWVNDTVTRENIEAALKEEIGINGKLALKPTGGALSPQEMPVRIQLGSPEMFGMIPWQRREKWRNSTPFPVRLKYLHALVIETNRPVVYTWNLRDTEIPSKARASFDQRNVPEWLDGQAKKFWIQYTVRASDTEAQTRAIDEIVRTAAETAPAQLVFQTLTPLADSGAFQINARVRSRFFQSRGQEVIEKPEIILNKDRNEIPIGAVYTVGRNGQEPIAEYTLSITLPDGTEIPSKTWIPVTGSRIVVGKVQLTQATGHEFASR